MDWSEKMLCIKCNGGGNLLICREDECPLAIHEGCLSGCRARFDDSGQFYCPYCWYKRAVGELRQARESVLAKNKALLIFIDEGVVGRGKCLEENKGWEGRVEDRSGVGGENVDIANKKNGDGGVDRSVCPDEEFGEEKVQEEEAGAFGGPNSQDNLSKGCEEQIVSDTDEKEVQEEELPNVSQRGKRGLKESNQMDKDSKGVSWPRPFRQRGRNNEASADVNTPRRSKRLSSVSGAEEVGTPRRLRNRAK